MLKATMKNVGTTVTVTGMTNPTTNNVLMNDMCLSKVETTQYYKHSITDVCSVDKQCID